MTFREAVAATPGLSAAWRPGLQALSNADQEHIRLRNSRDARGSVDLDAALRQELPNDARWDYGIAWQAGRSEDFVYWVEIHPANSGEIKAVLEKLRWLQSWLRESAAALDALPREFVWVASGKVALSPNAPQRRQIAQQGLSFAGRVLAIPRDEGGGQKPTGAPGRRRRR